MCIWWTLARVPWGFSLKRGGGICHICEKQSNLPAGISLAMNKQITHELKNTKKL